MKKNTIVYSILLLSLLVGFGIYYYQSSQEEVVLEATASPVEQLIVPEFAFQEGNFTDSRDKQTYKWVQYDNGQKWMAKNLNFKSTNSVCYDEAAACASLGRLYTWSEARKYCPKGWRLPNQGDWEKLFNHFGGATKAYTLLQEESSSFDITMGGAYDAAHTSFHFINQNGNYWTATSISNKKAIHFNFSKQFKKIFSLEEHKSLAFSCRCIEGPKEKIIASTNIPKEQEFTKEELPQSVLIPAKVVVPTSTPSASIPLDGNIFFEVYHSNKEAFQKLPIKGMQENHAADIGIGRPTKHKKEVIPTIRFQYTGKVYPYVINLTPNENPKIIHPKGDMDNADIILGKPKPNKKQTTTQQSFPTYFLQQKQISTVAANETNLLVLLSSTYLEEQELISKITGRQNEFIKELLLNPKNEKRGTSEAIQNSIQYQLPAGEKVIVPLLFSLKTIGSSS